MQAETNMRDAHHDMVPAYYETIPSLNRENVQPDARSLTAFSQIFTETATVALSEGNADPQLFEILIQGFTCRDRFSERRRTA